MLQTPPIEPIYPNGVSFAADIPVASDTMPSFSPTSSHNTASRDAVTSSSLSGSEPPHGRKKPDNHIRRPANCFVLFRADFIKNHIVTREVETSHSTLSQIIGLAWKNLPDAVRQTWYDKAQVVLEQHNLQYPEYSYKPKVKIAKKRKVREVSPKDHKRCTKIAELLIEGKKGQELSEAVHEFDKHHIPDTIIRFDTPVTAQTYLLSSSAPVSYIEDSTPSTSSPRKTRSSSSQPPRRSTNLQDTDILTTEFCPKTSFGLPAHPPPQSPLLVSLCCIINSRHA